MSLAKLHRSEIQAQRFELQVDGNDKQVMNFVVAKDTQIQGHVTTGTLVTVAYRPTEDGQNVALSITVRS